MTFITSIWAFLKNPKNRPFIWLAILAICALLFFQQCNQNKDLKNQIEAQKTETTRLLNNEQAKSAELKNYKLADSSNRGIIQGYQLTQKELQTTYKEMLSGFKDLEKKTALALAKGTVIIKETVYLQAKYSIDSSGNQHLAGYDTMKVDADNWRYSSFDAEFKTKYYKLSDSTEVTDLKSYGLISNIETGKSTIKTEQSIGLKVGLFQDKKDKKVYIVAQSKYPGLTFSKLEGADIMAEPDSKKVTRTFRREFGIGFGVGYGMCVDLKTRGVAFGPQISIGLHYTPKFLQWGK